MQSRSQNKRYEKVKEADKKPDDDDDAPREYVGASYHANKATFLKSAAPKNGQAALDRSFKVSLRTRVGISENEIVAWEDLLLNLMVVGVNGMDMQQHGMI